MTKNIRVGSGGVMLSHYSPFKVAECFSMLATLFPKRIDLGVGRAPGGTSLASSALAYPHEPDFGDLYSEKAHLLRDFIQRNLPDDHAYQALQPMPEGFVEPELWMLGSSGGSATLAGELGYNVALARFINPDNCKPSIFDAFRQAWQGAGHVRSPKTMLAIAAICAETEEEAKFKAGTAVYRKLAAQLGKRDDFLRPEQVRDLYQSWPESMKDVFDHILAGYTVGTPEQCWDEINTLATAYSCDELALVTVTYSQSDRLESYRLIGQNR
jgi:luciferase family oxidoreductase group 1